MAKKAISVIERRLQGGSALSVGSVQIPLKDDSYTIRWENSEIAPDHIWRCINILGWEYVEPNDIACALDEVGAKVMDTRVVRGERGKEVLLKMKAADYKKIQKKKSQENIAITFDKKKLKGSVLGQLGSEHGSEAADFVEKTRMFTNDSRERVSIED